MADGWIFWLAVGVGAALAALLSLAGFPVMGLFLGAVLVLSGRAALAPDARKATDETLRRTCDHLPFCDCEPLGRG